MMLPSVVLHSFTARGSNWAFLFFAYLTLTAFILQQNRKSRQSLLMERIKYLESKEALW